jgi:putative hydrolase of the HAD superfamily
MMPENGSEIRAVIFDYGEVLCHRPSEHEWERLAGKFGMERESFRPAWEKNRGAFDRGDVTAEQYWSALAADSGVRLDAAQLAQVYQWDIEMWGRANDEMVSWLRRLRSAGIKTGLLSNIHPDMIAYLRENFEWLDQFDFKTFSAEARLIKPDPAIYEHTLRGLGVAAAAALFIDDREINVKAAQAIGIRAILFQSIGQLRAELQGMGFAVLPE